MTGAVWGLTAAGVLGSIAIWPGPVFLLWKGVTAGAAGAMVAGERMGRMALRRKLGQLAAGEVELASLDERREGELVVVEGVIAAEATLRGVITDAPGVYRRMVFDTKSVKYVHEAAMNFALVDNAGKRILVEAAGARWITPRRELVSYPRVRFDEDNTPASVSALLPAKPQVEAIEDVLAPGTRVQVVGYKTASADVSGRVVDYRLPPQRATLRSGPALPLVITAVQNPSRGQQPAPRGRSER